MKAPMMINKINFSVDCVIVWKVWTLPVNNPTNLDLLKVPKVLMSNLKVYNKTVRVLEKDLSNNNVYICKLCSTIFEFFSGWKYHETCTLQKSKIKFYNEIKTWSSLFPGRMDTNFLIAAL